MKEVRLYNFSKKMLVISILISVFMFFIFKVSYAESGKIQEKQPLTSKNYEIKLESSLQKLKELINKNSIVRMNFTKMIEQVPLYYKDTQPPYKYLKSIDEMIFLINDALEKAPEFNESGLVGFPINAILNWTMSVPDGFAVYRNEKVNEIFRKILDDYGKFLRSKESLYVLNDGPSGWKSPRAMEILDMGQYIYDPNDEYWGFKSWNDFFIRKLKPGARPIAEPNNDKAITSGCDSRVFAIKNNVKKFDWFWVKSQPYSLNDIFDNDKALAETFEGGDVYQAFLSAFKYHRWHSPVSGTIKDAHIIQGTYYSGAESQGVDPASPDLSQGYIAHVATRALILIEADDPKIGLIAMLPVGMAEVSSNVINEKIKSGYHIKKGEEIGYFQYGGSTYLLIFRKGVIKEFNVQENDEVNVGQKIATAN